jgi:hypothetical protein
MLNGSSPNSFHPNALLAPSYCMTKSAPKVNAVGLSTDTNALDQKVDAEASFASEE